MQTRLIRFVVLLLLLAGIGLAVAYRDQLNIAALTESVRQAGAAGPLIFIVFYTIATVFFLPGSVVTLAGGVLFGPVLGTLYNLTGATIGAVLSFVIARYLAAGWVETKSAGRLKQLKQGVEAEGWRFVAFVRLVPFFPFNLLNYTLGLTRIPLLSYTLASFIFMLPGAIAYTYLGYAGREALAGGEGLIHKILIAVALLAVVGFIPGFIARLRRGPVLTVEELKQRLDRDKELLILDVRDAEEFTGELQHIQGARNIPLKDLSHRIDEVNAWQERPVLLICRTDVRSAKAAQLLGKYGFSDIHVVKGGMTAWNSKGYDTCG